MMKRITAILLILLSASVCVASGWNNSQRPEVASLGQLDWQIPKNPNFWTPLLGNLMFLTFAIPILAFKFFWITIPLIIAMALLIPNEIRFKRASCFDVGIECGGWGRIVLELKVEKKE